MRKEDLKKGAFYTDGKSVRRLDDIGPSQWGAYPVSCVAGEVSFSSCGCFPVVSSHWSGDCGPISIDDFAEWALYEVRGRWERYDRGKDDLVLESTAVDKGRVKCAT
jgi:hypothetical protein